MEAVVNENDNIGDIGRRLGFDVPAHFTRFFCNHTGVNPRQFRAVSRSPASRPAAMQHMK